MEGKDLDTSLIPTRQSELETALISHGLGAIVEVLPAIEAELKSAASQRVYRQDVKSFAAWVLSQEIDLTHLTRVDLLNYQKHLSIDHSNIAVNRMFTVARLVVAGLVESGYLRTSPLGKSFRPLKTNQESTHVALNEQQAAQLLKQIDTRTIKGKRDYALVSLMLRCGLRRDECRKLNIGNFRIVQGHYVVVIESGKGDQPGEVKVPTDVKRYIEEYIHACPRQNAGINAPLFISFRKGDNPSLRKDSSGKFVEVRIDVKAIETLVKDLGKAIGVVDLKPHGLRASFITLAMENGATLTQTQYAARHRDPRTTERYQKRKMNLDDNAVDKLAFLSREG